MNVKLKLIAVILLCACLCGCKYDTDLTSACWTRKNEPCRNSAMAYCSTGEEQDGFVYRTCLRQEASKDLQKGTKP